MNTKNVPGAACFQLVFLCFAVHKCSYRAFVKTLTNRPHPFLFPTNRMLLLLPAYAFPFLLMSVLQCTPGSSVCCAAYDGAAVLFCSQALPL